MNLLTTKQVAEMLSLHVATVINLAKSGEIKAMQIGRSWRFRPADIDKFMEEKTEK